MYCRAMLLFNSLRTIGANRIRRLAESARSKPGAIIDGVYKKGYKKGTSSKCFLIPAIVLGPRSSVD